MCSITHHCHSNVTQPQAAQLKPTIAFQPENLHRGRREEERKKQEEVGGGGGGGGGGGKGETES